MKICLATNNAYKVQEIKSLLNQKYKIISLKDINCLEELPETQNTLEGNSLQKAEYIYNNFHINALADDTGLEVVDLDGAPGVHSARYGGDNKSNKDNINLLLLNLKNKKNRAGQFRTIITLILEGKVRQFEGIVKGRIAFQRKGTKGFGYDSIFVPDGHDLTFAEMEPIEKNRISHRGIAIKKLVEYLNKISHHK
ncbi:non-canonical purine NTP diphosphatase [soil metagenome]